MKPIVFYHKDCSDGFGAAWAAWRHFGDSVEYRALSNGEPTPIAEFAGRETYFLDISAKPEAIEETRKVATKLTVIDHHGTNKEAAESADTGVYDLAHSGSVLTWHYFHKDKPVPKLLLLIEDMDLWKFTLPETKHVSMSLSLVPREFTAWSQYAELIETAAGLADENEKGKSLLAFSDHQIATVAKEAELVTFEGHEVFMANAPAIFASAMGHLLADRKPPFSMIWSRRNGQYKVSLRSAGEVDVAAIASKHGGGGHHNAAAFVVPTDTWPQFTSELFKK